MIWTTYLAGALCSEHLGLATSGDTELIAIQHLRIASQNVTTLTLHHPDRCPSTLRLYPDNTIDLGE